MDARSGGVGFAGTSSQNAYHNGASNANSGGIVRKRKCPSIDSSIDDDDEDMEVEDVKRFQKRNHSEIEKRRRDKMNKYILELADMLPMCSAMNRKCDKLTVLRMAVQHMKSLRGAKTSFTEASHKPSFLSDDDMKQIILQASDGFLFVVGCDRARILFVSESVKEILHYSRNDLIGQSLFDYIHPRDINKVKEQFSSSDLAPRERLIDAKTLMPVKTELPQRPTHLCSGARRSFYCRMKYRTEACDITKGVKLEKDDMEFSPRKRKSDQKSYTVIHFTGYLKSWPTSKINLSSEEDLDDSCNFLSCLVAVGRIRTSVNQSSSSSSSSITPLSRGLQLRPVEYMFRITLDGKLTFIDQATTVVLGYLPQELLGTSVYEYYHQDDITRMAEIHRKVLHSKEKVKTGVYRFKGKNGVFLHVRSTCFSFRNPWTKEVEYIVSTNSVVPIEEVTSSSQSYGSAGVMALDGDGTTEELSEGLSQEKSYVPGLPQGTTPGAGRIGRQIADEMLENSRESKSPQVVDSTNSDMFEAQSFKNKRHPYMPSVTTPSSSGYGQNMNPSTSTVPSGPNGISLGMDANMQESSNLLDIVISEQQATDNMSNIGGGGTDEGDEAAMSMIMSLLEADAGLGGPIDFNDLPWPL